MRYASYTGWSFSRVPLFDLISRMRVVRIRNKYMKFTRFGDESRTLVVLKRAREKNAYILGEKIDQTWCPKPRLPR